MMSIGESSTPKRMIAKSFSIQLVAQCPCGNVVTVHMIGGITPIRTQCPKCQTVYSLQKVEFELLGDGSQRCIPVFKTEIPTIARPSLVLPPT